MYAQLGDIQFDPLAGFDTYSESDTAVIAQHPLISGKPLPVPSALGLRQLTIGMRLRQEFIDVKQARLQLRAHKDQADVLTLTWGTGDVEGQFLIASLDMNAEMMDPIGTMISCNITIQLLEVPDGFLLASKQGSSYKAAFAANPKAYPAVVFKPPVPYEPTPWEQFAQYVGTAVRFAGMIDSLSYGGSFPNLGTSIGAIMGNADANLALMQTNFGTYGGDYDMDDISADITAAIAALGALMAIDPVTDQFDFQAANTTFQAANDVVCF